MNFVSCLFMHWLSISLNLENFSLCSKRNSSSRGRGAETTSQTGMKGVCGWIRIQSIVVESCLRGNVDKNTDS